MRWSPLAVVVLACHSSAPKPAPSAPASKPAPAVESKPEPAPAPKPAPDAKAKAQDCPHKPQPSACPATEPNINHPCSPKGIECTYGAGCCPPVYVCNKTRHFEARFTSCK